MIVITAPTGQIGRQLLDDLLDRGAPLRVIARDPDRLAPAVRDRAEVVRGSHADAGVVAAALDGAESVFWLVPPDPRADSLQEHVLRFVRPLCAAIDEVGVRRVVAVSSLGRGVAKDAGQVSAIFAMDALVESTGVAYRALCPPGFMDNLLWQAGAIRATGTLHVPLAADRKVPMCATRDIAAAAAELLADDTWSGQADVPMPGPEDLSYADVAQIIGEVLDRPVRAEPITIEAYKSALVRHGMSRAWAEGLGAMAAAAGRGIYDTTGASPADRTGTTLRQWCEEVLKPAVLG